MPERWVRRVAQLVVSCVVLGVGVALLLDARLGSDGYSTFVNGLSLATGVDFVWVNLVVGALLVAMAWLRGQIPGLGTVVQLVVVGVTVSAVLPLLPEPTTWAGRGGEMVLAFLVLSLGVAGYLASDLGAGPAEAAALAWDPPVPFRWGYTALQATGMLVGWACGASVGVGTLVVVLFIGWTVDRLLPLLSPFSRGRSRTPLDPARSDPSPPGPAR